MFAGCGGPVQAVAAMYAQDARARTLVATRTSYCMVATGGGRPPELHLGTLIGLGTPGALVGYLKAAIHRRAAGVHEACPLGSAREGKMGYSRGTLSTHRRVWEGTMGYSRDTLTTGVGGSVL